MWSLESLKDRSQKIRKHNSVKGLELSRSRFELDFELRSKFLQPYIDVKSDESMSEYCQFEIIESDEEYFRFTIDEIGTTNSSILFVIEQIS